MRSIPYDTIKGYSKIFLDYVQDFDRVGGYFSGDPSKPESWVKQFEKCGSRNYNRDSLAEILLEQNDHAGLKKALIKQIEKLRDPECTVIVTGQQAGLFWGPLYTVFKALTTVRMAEHIEQVHKRPVVPVFWLEVDDHDFDEIRRFNIMLNTGEVRSFEYSDEETQKQIPVNRRKISSNIAIQFEKLEALFGSSEISKKVISDLKKIYKPGRSLSEVFVLFFRKYFPKEPLVFINPAEPQVKRLAQPFFHEVLSRHSEIRSCIESKTKALTGDNFSPQVELRPNTAHVFLVNNDQRSRLDNDMIATFESENAHEKQSQLSGFLSKNIENLSLDVLLRPILQDYLLPTVAYIGGPSEISYIAQLKDAYAKLNVPMPLIVPRWSATIIERKTAKFLKKIDYDPALIVGGDGRELLPKVIERASGKQFKTQFEKAYSNLQDRLDEIRKIGASLDSTLVGMVDKSEQKMKYQLDKIQGRYQNALQAANKIAAERSTRALNSIIPENKMQERTYSIISYFLRYGKDFSRYLSRNVTIQTDKHHIVEY